MLIIVTLVVVSMPLTVTVTVNKKKKEVYLYTDHHEPIINVASELILQSSSYEKLVLGENGILDIACKQTSRRRNLKTGPGPRLP